MTREELRDYVDEERSLNMIPYHVYSALIDGIDTLEQEPRWIPVSEKYPKPEDEYKLFLVTDEEGVISVQTFYMSIEKEPQPYFSGMVNVIAWMPLPKPYKGESEG